VKGELTAERLRELLDYDAETGVFTWRRRADRSSSWNSRYAGKAAGSRKNPGGYILIRVGGYAYLAHRLAWLHTTGAWPVGQLDHADGNPSNSALANLREATTVENQRNARRRVDNTSGFKGVTRDGSGWRARIKVFGYNVCLGTYRTPEEAHAAYVAAAEKYHGEFARAA
jgi:hypothetical protein